MTDDGGKAAESDLMRAITGVDGAYEARAQDQRTRLQLVDRLQILC